MSGGMNALMVSTSEELPLRVAAGFVLARKRDAGLEYLALMSRRNGEPGLPKGHSDPGETEHETALRETAEETGLTEVDIRRKFRHVLDYVVTRRGRKWHKRVVLFAAYARSGKVRLSNEHIAHTWLPLDEMLDAMPWEDLDRAVYQAALFLKDPSLFEFQPATEAEAYAHFKDLPDATRGLCGHVRGGAKLARCFAQALADAGERVHVEATAAGAILHDVGRALGKHGDHQRAGVKHLRKTALAPYGFACISHFTKGASPKALRRAGVERKVVASFRKMTDMGTLTWEESCVALADACMRQDEPVAPAVRFADLRGRYDAPELIELQERRTEKIRRRIERTIGADPLALVGLG